MEWLPLTIGLLCGAALSRLLVGGRLWVAEQQAVLWALSAGPASGLELVKRLPGRGWRGRVYVHLSELVSKGLVTYTETEPCPERGNRPRRIYALKGGR